MNVFKNSDNFEFVLNTHHAGQKIHIMFVIVSINYSWVSQLDHRIVMSSVFDVRWKFDQIMSNQNKVLWGGWEITRKQIPAKTSPFHLWYEKKVFFSWFDFIFLFLVWLHSLPPCCPATTRLFSITWRANTCTRIVIVFYLSRSYSSTTSIIEESLRLEFQFIVVFYHSRSFFPAQKERRVCLYLTESEHLFSLPSIFRHSASLVAFAFCKMSRYKEQ